jgi:hypothetical protein
MRIRRGSNNADYTAARGSSTTYVGCVVVVPTGAAVRYEIRPVTRKDDEGIFGPVHRRQISLQPLQLRAVRGVVLLRRETHKVDRSAIPRAPQRLLRHLVRHRQGGTGDLGSGDGRPHGSSRRRGLREIVAVWYPTLSAGVHRARIEAEGWVIHLVIATARTHDQHARRYDEVIAPRTLHGKAKIESRQHR